MRELWGHSDYYAEADVTALLDGRAGREYILGALDDLARKAGPDDRVLIFLAGHGDFREQLTPEGDDSSWIFCCPRYDPARALETGIGSQLLQEKLAAIPCRKLVLLDACHSGEAARVNPVRGLTPAGQGPVILAACDRDQESYEDGRLGRPARWYLPPPGQGLFTYAVQLALEDAGAGADADGLIDVKELYAATRSGLPGLLHGIRLQEFDQVPILFAPDRQNYAVARARGRR